MFSRFKKRTTLIQNIAFMSLMAAINVVFVLLTTFIPFLVILMIFILPLTSVLVTIFCKKRYFLLYFLATTGLCMVCTLWNFSDTLFYVIPSMISGFVFGLFAIYKFPLLYLILGPSIIYFGFSYASIPLIQLIYGFNIIDTFANAFALGDFIYLDVITPSFIFIIALIQSTISYMIIKEEIKKFNQSVEENNDFMWLNIIINVVLLGLLTLFAFIYLPISYLMMIISLMITIYFISLDIASRKLISIIIDGIVVFISLLALLISYQYIPNPYQLLLFGILEFLITVKTFINKCLLCRNNKDKINTLE